MKLRKIFTVILALSVFVGMVGCTDVSVNPKSDISSETELDPPALKRFLAKLYAGLSLTGQEGPAGNPDLQQIDEGFSQYVRLYWQMQELPTDEAVIAWNDGNVQQLNTQQWSPQNGFASAMYARIFFQVAQANEFLRRTSESALDESGIEEAVRPQIRQWRAEARFLRALSYWHAIDLFGGVPLVTEEDPVGTGEGDTAPEKVSRSELFNFVDSELRAVVGEGNETLPPAGEGEYGRADEGAAWMVLAKLHQNSPVYLDDVSHSEASTEVLEFAGKVLDTYGASESALESEYHHLFLADNHTADGIIFAIPQDGQRSQSFGNTTYLVNASIGENMNKSDYGVECQFCGWAGLRTTPEAVDLYSSADERPEYPNIPSGGQFFQDGQSKAIEVLTDFANGYAVPKYQNITSGGERGSDDEFPDTDFPMFRLGDAFLMYAEAKLRGGSVPDNVGNYDAGNLVEDIRLRAGFSPSEADKPVVLEDAQDGEIEILDERARELFWEAHRRTDLIRFGEFTGDAYLWAGKGNSESPQNPEATSEDLQLYPIPANEIQSNPNLTQDDQNPGY